jgi:glutamine synthetase
MLMASILTAPNTHRLGANEAPPAIISAFLGTEVTKMLDMMEEAVVDRKMTPDEKTALKLNIGRIPEIILDNTDRNRTSPFAFTGNRFEFRAVGSSANCSSAMATLNAAVAAQLFEFKAEVDAKMAAGELKEKAIFDVIKSYIKTSKPIRFDGNGYSDEWKIEAAKRGLDCETSVPEIYKAFTTPESVKMFTETGVLTEKELDARNEVKWETYTKWVQIEARVLGDLSMNHIIPVATRYQSFLLDNVTKIKAAFPAERAEKLGMLDSSLIIEIGERIQNIKNAVDDMVDSRRQINKIENEFEKAKAYHDKVLPYFDVIRYNADKLELIVDDELWTLPKYRELLFIR